MTSVLQRQATTPSFQVRRSPDREACWTSSSASSTSSSDDESSQCNGLGDGAPSRPRVSLSPGQESLTAHDKPPRPPGAHAKGQGQGRGEAKSFLMRALGPVTNLFRHGSKTPTDDGHREEAEDGFSEVALQRTKSSRSLGKPDADSVSIKSNESLKGYKIRKQYSGDRPWWLESSENIADQAASGLQRAPSSRSLSKPSQDSDKESVKSFKLRKQYSGERPWWLDSADNIPAAIQRAPSTLSVNSASTGAASSPTGAAPEEKRTLAKLRPVDSGERPWWLDSVESIPEGVQRLPDSGSAASKASDSSERDRESQRDEAKFRITRIFSGERPWWMFNSNPTSQAPPPQQRRDVTASPSSSEESSEDEDRPRAPTPPRRQRPPAESDSSSMTSDWPASTPAGTPAPTPSPCPFAQQPTLPPPPPVRSSSRPQAAGASAPSAPSTPRAHRPQRPRHLPLFIGGHTNIDDILGNVVPISSPSLALDPDMDDLDGDSSDSEQAREVGADQVRVHDSVAHTAVIEHRQQQHLQQQPSRRPPPQSTRPVFQPPGMIK
ncbi:uncharacterized protein LOC127751838, partial [Frankliniella occidentalis]|uniref:Uncharacterized protein LOC127751838 n=1 Tax=Frankliniella occidentalis TaxID=133901 RepID=A0A9C6XA92_FRAOC